MKLQKIQGGVNGAMSLLFGAIPLLGSLGVFPLKLLLKRVVEVLGAFPRILLFKRVFEVLGAFP